MVSFAGKTLVGKRMTMSLVDNRTGMLWRSFMTSRKQVKHASSDELFAVQVYSNSYFSEFNPHTLFEKWAAIEVSEVSDLPSDMELLIIPSGLYAVFHYKGLSSDSTVFEYIYNNWLLNSNFELENRPHFEVLGRKYQNNHPESEEKIWIPVKSKT